MDFREYAATEALASLRRLHAGPIDVCREQLDALRAAVEASARALDAASNPAADAERDLADLVERLTQAAADAAEQAATRASDEAKTTHDALLARLQTQHDESEALGASLKEAQAQIEALQTNLAVTAERADAVTQELAYARDAQNRFDAERHELTSALDHERHARTTAERELHEVRDLLVKTRAEAATTEHSLATTIAEKSLAEDAATAAQSQAEAAEAKLAAVTDLLKTSNARVKALERSQQQAEQRARDLETRLVDAPAPAAEAVAGGAPEAAALFAELLGAFQALASATTINDVLITLMEHLATEFSRVALFRTKSNHLQGEHQIGFDQKTDIRKVVMPLGMDSLLTRAAASRQIERVSGNELADTSDVPFSGTPSCAIAVPVVVGDETLAIVYADDVGASADGRGPEGVELKVQFADALLHHAGALLSTLKTQLKALEELRTYAGSLLQEIESMYAADAAAGRSEDELLARLSVNLEYARSIYANRVTVEGADAGGLLADAIVGLVETEASTPFGRHLAKVAGISVATAGRASAQAS